MYVIMKIRENWKQRKKKENEILKIKKLIKKLIK